MTNLPSTWLVVDLEQLLAPLEDGRLMHHGWSPQCEKEPSDSEAVWGVLKTTAIQPGSFLAEHNKRLPDDLAPRPMLEVRTGDLLITSAGPRARCGVACLVPRTRPRLMLSGKMYRFRFDDRFVDPRYVEAYLLSPTARRAIDAMKTGISDSGLNLTHGRFRKLQLPLAPRAEQRRIVAAIEEQLSRLDAADASLAAALRRTAVQQRAVLFKALEDAGSPTVPASALVSVSIGGVWGHEPGADEVDVSVFRVTEFRDGGVIDPSTAARRSITRKQLASRQLRSGDLLIEKSGGGPDRPVGRVAFVPVSDGPAVCSNFVQFLRPDAAQIDPAFLFRWLQRRYLDGSAAEHQTASTNIRNLKTADYLALPVPVPPLDEQRRIVAEVEERLAAVDRLRAAVTAAQRRSRALRAAILERAFRGELVPQDPSDEPAEHLLARIRAAREASHVSPGRRRKSQ